MADRFPDDVVQAVTGHMNDDHLDDSLAIVRGNGAPGAVVARMIDLDTAGGTWAYIENDAEHRLTIDWPIPVVERADVRRAVVELFEAVSTS